MRRVLNFDKPVQRKKILVADDDTAILQVIKLILEESGYAVYAVSDGSKVVDQVNKTKPDVILLDIWMSGYDGRDLSQTLKAKKETKNIPIIVVSAHNETERMAKEAGADGFISKPFDMDYLLETVRKYLN